MDELVLDRRHKSRLAPPDTGAATPRRRLLWGPDDLLRWTLSIFAGAIVIGGAWYVGAGDIAFKQQIGPTDVAVAGLMLSGLGNATWLLRGRRAVGERRRALLPDPVAQVQRVRQRRGEALAPVLDANSIATPVTGTEVFLAGPGTERFHRPACALAAGRSGWTTMTRQEHVAAGRKSCGVCQP